ncbi:hypothetical protein FIT82_04145 [Candidatus Methylopumilus universalis]|nr:hypothetical protein [Candidatus Methylopumilus universalis]QDC81660.1 hypothetical protein FIT82_04145 [Candidatus Methylopumilus universalis]QDC88098.1 hypothetical protein FIT81_04145 [Candidatus Methylopumilus universalis]
MILDVAIGLAIAIVGFLFKPTHLASFISVVYVTSTIVPGLILTGYARKVSLGYIPNIRNILVNSLIAFFITLFITLFFIMLFKRSGEDFRIIFTTVTFFSIASVCQSLNIIWYYAYENKNDYLKIKLFTTFIRAMGILCSIVYKEISFVLISLSFTQITDAFFGIHNLKKSKINEQVIAPEKNSTYLIFGLSIAISRSVLSIIKVMIEQLVGSFLPILLLFEQVFSGISGLYERYLLGFKNLPNRIRYLKYGWIFFVLGYYMAYHIKYSNILNYQLLLALMASLSILPTYYTYNLIRSHGLIELARVSILTSFLILVLCFVNYYQFQIIEFYGVLYMMMPILLFIFLTNRKKLSY